MTVVVESAAPRVKPFLIKLLMLLFVNVPTVSFGLAMGWVSLASGAPSAPGETAPGDETTLVGAAAATFLSGLVAVPLGARALQHARRPVLAATSAAFAVCWSLTLAGGWWVVVGRVCAGAGGALAWCLAPLVGSEVCSGWGSVCGAAPVLAHNTGMLLMYLAAYLRITHSVVVWWCLALSVVHCGSVLLAPESPAYLASRGRYQEAVSSLACLRGVLRDHPSLAEEVRSLPALDQPQPLLTLAKDMLSEDRRRRAFLIALVAVVGQEACGVLTLLQFAERVFLLAGEGHARGEAEGEAARSALVLGAVQLVAAGAALALIDRLPRRPLLVWCAVITGGCLALGAGSVYQGVPVGGAGWGAHVAAPALVAAVAADSLGLQPAPYALLHDMFHHQYRGCVVLLVMAAASAGNAAETLVLPAVVHTAGLWAALLLAATITLLYALFALIYVPETKDRSVDQIYDAICPEKKKKDEEAAEDKRRETHKVVSDNNYNTVKHIGFVSNGIYTVPLNSVIKTVDTDNNVSNFMDKSGVVANNSVNVNKISEILVIETFTSEQCSEETTECTSL